MKASRRIHQLQPLQVRHVQHYTSHLPAPGQSGVRFFREDQPDVTYEIRVALKPAKQPDNGIRFLVAAIQRIPALNKQWNKDPEYGEDVILRMESSDLGDIENATLRQEGLAPVHLLYPNRKDGKGRNLNIPIVDPGTGKPPRLFVIG